MSKYFTNKGQYINGNWVKKKVRLPRKVKKWLKLLQSQNNKFTKNLTFFKPDDRILWKIFAELRVQRQYKTYYKKVIKYKSL